MLIVLPLLAGNGEWPGPGGPPGTPGIVPFTRWDSLPRTTQLVLDKISWFAPPPAAGLALTDRVSIELRADPAIDPLLRIPLCDAIVGTTTDPTRYDSSASVLLCPTSVPRFLEGGAWVHCELYVESLGLDQTVDSILLVEYHLEPQPELTYRDGRVV